MNETASRFEHILTRLEKTELQGRVFRDCEIAGVDLSGADLRGARFERVLLADCSLAGADLSAANFVLCELRGVVLTSAVLHGSRFDGTTLDDLVVLDAEGRAHVEGAGGTFQHRRASLR